MKRAASQVYAFWTSLSTLNAIFFGFLLGVTLDIVPHLAWGWPVFSLGFLVYFPFHAWLTFTYMRVLLFRDVRSKILGEGYSFFGAMRGYLSGKYALFCLSWWFTMWLYAVSVIGL